MALILYYVIGFVLQNLCYRLLIGKFVNPFTNQI